MMKLLMSVLALLVVPFPGHAQPPPPIIDMHLHASADDWYADGAVGHPARHCTVLARASIPAL